jgi:integrase
LRVNTLEVHETRTVIGIGFFIFCTKGGIIMRGWIEAHGTGYRYKIEFDKDSTGKRKTISKSGFKKQKDAKNALAEKLTEVNNGTYIQDNKLTVEAYLKEWLDAHKTNVAPSTYKRYGELCNTVNKHLGNIELQKLTSVTIQKFYSNLISTTELSNSTIIKVHRVFSLALKQAVGWKMLNSNPCEHVKPPRAENFDIQVWDEATVKKFLVKTRNEEIYIVIAIALGTGMRLGEICALKWENVDLKKGEIYVRKSVKKLNGEFITKEPKTKSSIRRIPLSDDLKDLLTFHKKKQDKLIQDNEKYKDEHYVCAWEHSGKLYDPMYIAKKFPKLLIEYDMPKIRFHDLRHYVESDIM